MKGMELSRRYYEAFGKDMIHEKFPEVESCLAVGLAGSGSECLGYDDAISEDHDFGPGFCIFLPGEEIVSGRTAFLMERAYASLPGEFEGYKRPLCAPVGGLRTGVIRISDFFLDKTGSPDGILSTEQWLRLPAASLSEAVGGSVFSDPYGLFGEIRERLRRMPEDIRLKRLAGNLLLMAQSGQYNYQRCLDHAEPGAAQLAAAAFVRSALSAIFLLNERYEPYYKWVFRALRDLPVLSETETLLTAILSSGNDPETSFEKYNWIEEIASKIISVLIDENLTRASCGDLEKHAYSVNDRISDGEIRNLHILAGV